MTESHQSLAVISPSLATTEEIKAFIPWEVSPFLRATEYMAKLSQSGSLAASADHIAGEREGGETAERESGEKK